MKIRIRIKNFLSRHLSPSRIFLLSFISVILTGAILLWLPFSANSGHLRFIDALFTSTSAVCVTGLVVIDNGKDLSLLGQVITIFLFQIGGLGIITFSTVFFVMMGRGISFKGREIVQTTFLHTPRRDFFAILKSVLIFTLFFESLGILLLFTRFSRDFPVGKALYQAIYHAISAFNNCGFSLFPDSLMRYQGDLVVNLTVMGLLVIGGIGFIVQYEVFSKWKGVQKKLSLHSRMALMTTGILIFSGAILFYFFERNHILKDVPIMNKFLASLFQSVTPRTCGFNTVDIGLLTNATILLLIVLMFIGASPGSTGGGIKTTSLALLLLMIWNRFRGNEEVNISNRTIPREIISRTLSIIFASAFSISLITSVLLITGGGNLPPLGSRYLFVEYLFETVSAFGTVGLSMGVTSELNDIQRAAIILMMFAGRVGPLTLAFSLSRGKGGRGLTYAEEGVMVG
ncbi:MAG: TrkH family potassium uptake protein [Thermodesulfobacteriota bacterium]|nr:TrkH family potassium uptake protein [Thermodesulfobacteriota bacterium]